MNKGLALAPAQQGAGWKYPTYMSSMYGSRVSPRFPTVTDAIFHYVSAQPDAIAARELTSSVSREITYHELAVRSARLTRKLRELGVAPGQKVPLVVKRGIDMLVGIVAILSCGAQYVPLDGGVVPDSTLRFVVEQTGGQNATALVIESTKHRFNGLDVANIVSIDAAVDDEKDDMYSESWVPQNLAEPDFGCYVIYTSGTTGTPKGVDVTHKNVVNLVCTSPGDLDIGPGKRVGQILNISFDMAAWEMLGCLCNGGTLILRGSDWEQALSQVDVLISTPSILAKYSPQVFPNIQTVATAGEPSSQRLADTWASHGTYYNCCGPTETTIVNTMHKHVPGQPLTIGKPTPNNNVYILTDSHQLVSDKEAGVMWAGGLGVTRGYVGLPEKTAERYLPDPFTNDGSMMYNTGDLGRWTADGSVDILGRVDDQIKLKGFRIELDGITASLNACPIVDRASVLLVDDEIHAFISPATCDIEVVKEHMKKCQPYYAVPSHFHPIGTLPLTDNGKVDKKSLHSSCSSFSSVFSASSAGSTDALLKRPKAAVVHAHSVDSSVSTTLGSIAEDTTSASSIDEKSGYDLEAGIPDKKLNKRMRGIRHRILIVYRRLFSFVGIFNIIAVIALLCTGIHREWMGTLTAINLVLAVLIRQDFVINILYTVTCSVPKSWPLWLRARCARIFHLGGVHSGAAVSSALWLLANNLSDAVCNATDMCTSAGWGRQSIAAQVVSWILTCGFVIMLVMAYPEIRKKHHDTFERTHRFVGWTMLGLFWVQVVLTANDSKAEGTTLGDAVLRTPSIWLLVVATLSIASSWLFLRKVPVEAEVLSDHAVRLHFDYTVPVNGSFSRLSRKPLVEWHSFATIPAVTAENGRKPGYSLIVSNAGDWTKNAIQEPPTHIWTRGVPTCGVMRIATLFNRIVIIGTGSGIGPLLGHIQNPSCPTQLIWSTKNPEQTFGEELCNTIRSKVPGSVIWDTRVSGRPDLVKMGYNMVKGFGAEAVVIIANEKITKKVVYGLETRGIPAYGAIFDS